MSWSIGDASWIEILWSAVSLLCLIANAGALVEAWGDRNAVRLRGINGARKITARKAVRTELVRSLIQAGFLGIGVLAMLTPPPIRESVSRNSVIFGLVFVAMEVALATVSILDSYDTRRLNDYIDAAISANRTDRKKEQTQ